ncbi:hypothetical protein AMJ47_00545 [Parcubacteria bacterium DG_72]|nr:MAG: hypothetical protein AMJ47_00545 [Parcubacteria bacterium DG_72]
MQNNKNLTLIVVIGLIVIIGIAAFLILNPLKPAGPEEGEEAGITPPEATGNINDLTDALEKEIIDELNLVYEDDEADIIISDTEEINDFGQSADDTGL